MRRARARCGWRAGEGESTQTDRQMPQSPNCQRGQKKVIKKSTKRLKSGCARVLSLVVRADKINREARLLSTDRPHAEQPKTTVVDAFYGGWLTFLRLCFVPFESLGLQARRAHSSVDASPLDSD